MDYGLANGIYSNKLEGNATGLYDSIKTGLHNGVYNENMLKDNISKDGLILYLDAHIPQSYPKTGGTWFDLSNKKNNTTLIDGATFQSARNGSFYFDGTNDYMNLSDKDIFTFSNGTNDIPFSICCWVNLTSYIEAASFFVAKSKFMSTLWHREWFFAQNNTLGVTFAIYNPDTSGGNSLVIRSSVINTSQWYFLTATYNGNKNNNGMLIYHNAVLQSTTTANAGTYTGMGNTIAEVEIGRQSFDVGSQSWLNGNIGQLLIYRNKVLNQSEINNIYQATKSRFNL